MGNATQVMNPNQALWEHARESASRSMREIAAHEGRDVLDLGCGDGTTALPAARRGADVLGVDIARNLVDAGNQRAQAEGLTNCRFQMAMPPT